MPQWQSSAFWQNPRRGVDELEFPWQVTTTCAGHLGWVGA